MSDVDRLLEAADEVATAVGSVRVRAREVERQPAREVMLMAGDSMMAAARQIRIVAESEAVRAEEEVKERHNGVDPIVCGSIMLDPRTRQVTVDGNVVRMAAKEYSLLRALISDPRRVFTKGELLRDVWGCESMGSSRSLDSHASRLRRRLNGSPDRQFVVNVWGVGYRLVEG